MQEQQLLGLAVRFCLLGLSFSPFNNPLLGLADMPPSCFSQQVLLNLMPHPETLKILTLNNWCQPYAGAAAEKPPGLTNPSDKMTDEVLHTSQTFSFTNKEEKIVA